MKIYTGISDGMGGEVLVAKDYDVPRKLNPRLDLFNHSPAGFAWGYGGSGPAQTALAILADHFRSAVLESHAKSRDAADAAAVRLHQQFKWKVIAPLNQKANFMLTSGDIDEWLLREDRES